LTDIKVNPTALIISDCQRTKTKPR